MYLSQSLRAGALWRNAITLKSDTCFRRTLFLSVHNPLHSHPLSKKENSFALFTCNKSLVSFNKDIYLRSYSKKPKKRKVQEDSDSEGSDDETEDDILDKFDRSSAIIKKSLQTLRMDAIIKAALGLARNKVDLAFYESRIRVNGKKVLKKSIQILAGDEIDIIKGTSKLNPNLLTVSRIEVISVKPEGDEFVCIKMRRFKSLNVENYEEDPYVQVTPEVQ